MTTGTAVVRQSSAEPAPLAAATLEKVVIGGDLTALTPGERVSYYLSVCNSVGLNPATRPFEYLRLNNKLVLYARKDATDQLRSLRNVSIVKLECERIEDVYIVRAYAKDMTGREDVATGAVPIAGLKGELLSNAFLKCETKAKRRVTLSICGLGLLDESEVGSISDARPVMVDTRTGEVLDVAGAIEDQKAAKKAKAAAAPKLDPFEQELQDERKNVAIFMKSVADLLQVDQTNKEAFSLFARSQAAAALGGKSAPETIEEWKALRKHLEARLVRGGKADAPAPAPAAAPAEPALAGDQGEPF